MTQVFQLEFNTKTARESATNTVFTSHNTLTEEVSTVSHFLTHTGSLFVKRCDVNLLICFTYCLLLKKEMVAYFQTMYADTPKIVLSNTHTYTPVPAKRSVKKNKIKKIRWGLRQRSYFGHVGALHVVFVDPDLLFILSPHVRQGLRQFILVLLLPSGVHLHQSSLVALPGVLHLLQNSRNQSQKSFTVFSGVIKLII